MVALGASACESPFGRGGGGDAGRSGGGFPIELGEPAAPLPGAATTTAPPAGGGGPVTTTGGTSPPTTSPTPGTTAAPPAPTATTAAPASPYRVVGRADDPAGDHGPEGPAHADLVGLTVERDATSMRVTVQMAGELPAALPTGQVQGVGVDLYRGPAVESAYQLFVDGGSDGWRAYLQVGTTFVDYPGQFRLGGTTLELTVPLDAFATGEPEAATAFADWSAERPVLNAASEDDLPTLGRVTLSG